jgi:LPXTG-motif cell wall-anchored protein
MVEPARTTPITRDDIERRLRAVQGDLAETGENIKHYAIAIGAVVAVAAVALAFGFGRRRGRKRQTIVEVRRF